ncbi:hypothetical protein [uncultured Aquimarina sp.]|uniref:hypothetical protein n=1 Tax=uncultured Aquimarina sp. TaxID=575652 RepID=UPI0026396D6E|nr:hypothetical protein [uncultured Aquimarina sp.]
MKRLLNLLIVVVTFIACKQTPKDDVATGEIKEQPEKIIKETPKLTQQEKEQTIEEFLEQLQVAVKNNDVTTIEKSLKFPFEFNWGGESSFYNSYEEIRKDSGKFSYILEAKSIEREGDMFIITYQDPEDIEYFVSFIAIKEGDDFMLTTFMQPH